MRKFKGITSNDDANVYVGPEGEIVIGIDNRIRIQDHVTVGGILCAPDGITGPTGPIGNIGYTGPTGVTGADSVITVL